jgi:hypothetical protein
MAYIDLNNATLVYTKAGYQNKQRINTVLSKWHGDTYVAANVATERITGIFKDEPIIDHLLDIDKTVSETYLQAFNRAKYNNPLLKEWFNSTIEGEDTMKSIMNIGLDKEHIAYFLLQGQRPYFRALEVKRHNWIRLLVDK